jgi:hypothetical protein
MRDSGIVAEAGNLLIGERSEVCLDALGEPRRAT